MTASGINSGPFLPTWMEIPFLSFNVSCKLKLLRFKKKKIQYLNCGEKVDWSQRKHSHLIVFAHGTATQFVARLREKPTTNPSSQLSQLLTICHPPNSDFFFLGTPGLNDLVWRV